MGEENSRPEGNQSEISLHFSHSYSTYQKLTLDLDSGLGLVGEVKPVTPLIIII